VIFVPVKLGTKILLLISLLLGLLGAVLPLGLGLLLERGMPQTIAELDRQLGGVSLNLTGFERHWFDSEFSVSVEPAGQTQALVYQSRLIHGPWPLAPLAWISGQGRLLHPASGQLAEDQWHLSAIGNLHAEIFSKWGDATGGEHLDLQLQVQTAQRFNQVVIKLPPSSARFGEQFEALEVDGSVRFNRDDNGDWALKLDLLGDSLALDSGQQTLDQPVVALGLSASNNQVQVSIELAADRLDAGADHHYQNLDAQLTLEHLHRPSLATWLAAIAEAHKSGLRGAFLLERARGDLLMAMPGLLANQPWLRLDTLSLISNEGPAQATARFGFPLAPPAGFLGNPLLLIEVLALEGQLQLPETLAQHWATLRTRSELGGAAGSAEIQAGADEFLLRLRANQLLVREAGDYRMQFELKEGELTLNGQSMLLPVY
jgi:uncharacterized protein YdgA (DUF945 family)